MPMKFQPVLFSLVLTALLAAFLTLSLPPAVSQTGPPEMPDLLAEDPSSTRSAANDDLLYLPLVVKSLSLTGQMSSVTLQLPTPLAGTAGSWCTWSGCALGPRLYLAPLADDSTLIGWTDQQGTGHVTRHTNGATEDWLFPNQAIRGLTAHADGGFAVLLWDTAAETIRLSRRQANGSQIWTTNLNSDIARAEFWLGDGRLEYGNGLYAAYFTVKGVSGGFTGHYGDQLTYVSDSGVVQTGGWNWGCSHSMAQLVTYHPQLDQFAAVCSSDCFPDKSIHWVNASHQIYQADGNCGGLVSAQLGQMAVGNDSWKLVFNAQEQPCCTGKGIALATLTADQQSSYTWLTNSNGQTERDPAIARLGASVTDERYLVGWLTTQDNSYWLGVIDETGNFIIGPDNMTAAGVSWGNRDESFRTRVDGRVSWVQGAANSSQIRLFTFDGAPFLP
ncbi:MAG: hypothetical protein R6X34_16760 [Chloroflexota bacterium]